MLHEEHQEVSRFQTLLAYNIDHISNGASVLGEVEFVCFNCICLDSVPYWKKWQLFSNSRVKVFFNRNKVSRLYFPFKELLREL